METTPIHITDEIRALCKKINDEQPVYIPVVVGKGCIENECFANVENITKTHGGKRVLGWAVWQRDNILLQGEAHAVWKNTDGDLIDVTPHNYNEKSILFLPDSKLVFNHKTIPSIYKPLTNSSLVEEYIGLLYNRQRFMISCEKNEHIIPMNRKDGCYFLELNERIIELDQMFKRKVGRNEFCTCGSGIKYKHCCGRWK